MIRYSCIACRVKLPEGYGASKCPSCRVDELFCAMCENPLSEVEALGGSTLCDECREFQSAQVRALVETRRRKRRGRR